jgi:hypothetical protein
MTFLLGALLGLAPAAPPVSLPQVERAVFMLANAERTKRGLPALQPDDTLDAIARAHSFDMLRRRFFDHTNPDGDGPGDRMGRAHRTLIGEGGENVWAGAGYQVDAGISTRIVSDWMNSAGHRANILNREYTHLGVGIATEGVEIRATQNFAEAAAFLVTPVPRAIRRGQALDLAMKPVARVAPVQFDLWSEESRKRVFGPAALAPVPIEAPPGSYRLRFYFPIGNRRFTVRVGPEITVR